MSGYRLVGCFCILMTLQLTACPKSASNASSTQPAASQHPQPPQAAPATRFDPTSPPTAAETAEARRRSKLDKLRVHTGGPLPPQVLPAPVQLDRSCYANTDCMVKDVGSCCGTLPACVNINSPTDPAAVQAQCTREGQSSVCGFGQISACTCVRNRCVSDRPAIAPSIDPVPQPPEER